MNKEIIKLTEDLGNVYTEISKKKLEITKLRAKREVLEAKIWESRKDDMDKRAKEKEKKN